METIPYYGYYSIHTILSCTMNHPDHHTPDPKKTLSSILILTFMLFPAALGATGLVSVISNHHQT